MKKILLIFTAIILTVVLTTADTCAFGKFQTYPKDGHFKQLPGSRDYWYFIDQNNWYIKAPDKFQHMMGCYLFSEVGDQFMDKYLAGAVVFGVGLYKEYDDGMREGWSPRDLLMNTFGVFAGIANTDKYHFWMDWDEGAVILNFSISLR
ncbi:MAG: hypothetical protein GF310_00425 [candidate division Zixibacteria bacterium]|nr:hypothetical protein [candidate division Zixibacteria bacterium]